MNLVTSNQTELFNYSFEGLTVIEPGETIKYQLTINPLKQFHLKAIEWVIPDCIKSDISLIEINLDLDPSATFTKEILFFTIPGKEDFGEISFRIDYSHSGSAGKQTKDIIWISVYERKVAGVNSLDDELRNRLVNVVNFRPQNGHIFLADYASFFDDFLNITVPPQIVEILSEDFALPNEGLPLQREKYIEIITGKLTFYGMTRLELLFEEYCNESDDRFDLQEAKEVINPNI
jgi:hypothetical protein